MDQSTYTSSKKLSVDKSDSNADSAFLKLTLILAGLAVWIVLCIQSSMTSSSEMIAAGVIIACLMTLKALSPPVLYITEKNSK